MALCRHACSCTPSSPLISSTRFFTDFTTVVRTYCSAGAAPPYVGIYTLYVAVRRASPSGSGWCSSAAQSPQRRGQRGWPASRQSSRELSPCSMALTCDTSSPSPSEIGICDLWARGVVCAVVQRSSSALRSVRRAQSRPVSIKVSFQDRRGDAPRVAT